MQKYPSLYRLRVAKPNVSRSSCGIAIGWILIESCRRSTWTVGFELIVV